MQAERAPGSADSAAESAAQLAADAALASRARSEVTRFRALRWVGMLLFVLALPIVLLILANIVTGQAPLLRALNIVLALGLSLGSFGTANDSAMAAMGSLYRRGALTGDALTEYQRELLTRPARLAEAHAAPRMALVMPVLATLAISWAGWRALTEAGLLP